MNTQYNTIRVKFSESIESINEEIFIGKENRWGVSALKEWIDATKAQGLLQLTTQKPSLLPNIICLM